MTCFQGSVRKTNEDNFLVNGLFLPEVNYGLDRICSGQMSKADSPVFAVFDGMGGEEAGEVAAYLAAREMDRLEKKKLSLTERMFPERMIVNTCDQLNQRICSFAKEHRISTMGCTAAYVKFIGGTVYCVNLGDSRIYQILQDDLIQVSHDHVLDAYVMRKAPLTQFLGIPEEEMRLSPSVVSLRAEVGMKFLICTDGLTDMLSAPEILRVLRSTQTPEDGTALLEKAVLQRGAVDNTTIILCEVCHG